MKFNTKRLEDIKNNRRKFLKQLSASSIGMATLKASPILAGLLSARYANANEIKKRLAICHIHSGSSDQNSWLPSGETNMNFDSAYYGPSEYGVTDNCNFFSGVMDLDGHTNNKQALGAPNGGETFDVTMSRLLSSQVPYSSMFLGSGVEGSAGGGISSELTPMQNLVDTMDQYFNLTYASLASNPSFTQSIEIQRQAVNNIKTKLANEELIKLDQHLYELEVLQNKVSNLATIDPNVISENSPNISENINVLTSEDLIQKGKLQVDILISALKCNLTNFVMLQIGSETGGWTHELSSGEIMSAHNVMHNVSTQHLSSMNLKENEVPAYFIDQLRSTQDLEGGMLLDSTAFLQTADMGVSSDHSINGAPLLFTTRLPFFTLGFRSDRDVHIRSLLSEIGEGFGLEQNEMNLGDLSGLRGANILA